MKIIFYCYCFQLYGEKLFKTKAEQLFQIRIECQTPTGGARKNYFSQFLSKSALKPNNSPPPWGGGARLCPSYINEMDNLLFPFAYVIGGGSGLPPLSLNFFIFMHFSGKICQKQNCVNCVAMLLGPFTFQPSNTSNTPPHLLLYPHISSNTKTFKGNDITINLFNP